MTEYALIILPQTLCYSLSRLCLPFFTVSFIPLLQSLFSSSGNDLEMISRIPLAFQILNIQESESGLPEQFCYRKLKTGQTINLVKPLLGLMLQHKGVKTSNRCPCLLPHRQWRGEWGGDLVLGVKVGADPRVGLEGCFGCFVHLPGVAVCKDHVQYPAFGPSSSDVIVGCLVFCILFIICPDSACIRYF